ncbi:ABC transporter permease [bacterium]|nr:ABC transporter permease [bacterium]
MLFVRRDFVTQFKQTILGPLWFFIQPLMTTGMFVVVFGKIAKIPTDNIPPPLFYMSGIVFWNFFSGSLTRTSNVFVANAGIMKKVYFPRLTIPISTLITGMMRMAIQLSLFFIILFYYFMKGAPVGMNAYALLLPFLIIHLALLGLAVGLIISALTTKYRDLSFLVQFGMQLWMYATPIVYPLSQVPEKWRFYYSFNPVVPMLELFKKGFLGAGSANWMMWGISFGVTLILLFIGIIVFNAVERTFVDTV